MKLLIATDHRYYGTPSGIFDTYCFDRSFFDDYRSVFDEVQVAARVRHESPPETARRSDGRGVSFSALPDMRGGRWLVAAPALLRRQLRDAAAAADAVCVRIPSVTGRICFDLARRLGKPVMFELIGDPIEALRAHRTGMAARLASAWEARAVRKIARGCVAGSYVSIRHLQTRYPAGAKAATESISSIRLPREEIVDARSFSAPPRPLRVVTVASLVPVKCHDVLLRAVAGVVERGGDVVLELVGDGPRRAGLEELATRLGLTDRIHFHGHVADRAVLRSILDRSDLFAMTSASEGMPRSMLEAMARGLPAVGTRAGGIAEILRPRQLVDVGDHGALSRLILDLSERAGELTEMSAYSREVALTFVQDELARRRHRILTVLRDAASRRAS